MSGVEGTLYGQNPAYEVTSPVSCQQNVAYDIGTSSDPHLQSFRQRNPAYVATSPVTCEHNVAYHLGIQEEATSPEQVLTPVDKDAFESPLLELRKVCQQNNDVHMGSSSPQETTSHNQVYSRDCKHVVANSCIPGIERMVPKGHNN